MRAWLRLCRAGLASNATITPTASAKTAVNSPKRLMTPPRPEIAGRCFVRGCPPGPAVGLDWNNGIGEARGAFLHAELY